MKKLLSILLTMAVFLSLVACGGDSAASDENAGLVYPYNIVNRPMKAHDVYDYKTVCYSGPGAETNGHIYIYDYSIEPAGDGMVDKTVKAMLIFDDDNAWNYGMRFDVLYADITGDDTYTGSEDWKVEMDGTEYPVTVIQDEFISGEWTPMGNFVSKYVLTVRVPQGYDDIGLFFYNTANKLDILDENGDIPDGTPITHLIDGDSQWFVLGGKGDDWDESLTTTYYGQTYKAQANNIAIEDVLGGTPVFDVEEDYGDEAPTPIPEDDGDEGLDIGGLDDGFTYVELDEWSDTFLRRNKKTDVTIYYSTYNTSEGDYVLAQVFADDTDRPLYEKKLRAFKAGYNTMTDLVVFEIDAADFPDDISGATIWFTLCDADDSDLSSTMLDLPFIEESKDEQVEQPTSPSDKNAPWMDARPAVDGIISSIPEYTSVNFFYEVHNLRDGLYIRYKATSIDNPDAVHDEFEFEVLSDGSISVDVWREKLAGDYVIFAFQLVDEDETVLTEKQFNIKVS